MEVKCINGEIVVTHLSGFVSKYGRGHYEEIINREREMLAVVQSNIREAEKMIELIAYDATPKVNY